MKIAQNHPFLLTHVSECHIAADPDMRWVDFRGAEYGVRVFSDCTARNLAEFFGKWVPCDEYVYKLPLRSIGVEGDVAMERSLDACGHMRRAAMILLKPTANFPRLFLKAWLAANRGADRDRHAIVLDWPIRNSQL